MTRDETKKLLNEIYSMFPRLIGENTNKALMVDLWTEALEGQEYQKMHNAFIRYVQTDSKGFPPTAGQLLALSGWRADQYMSDEEAAEIMSKLVW